MVIIPAAVTPEINMNIEVLVFPFISSNEQIIAVKIIIAAMAISNNKSISFWVYLF